MSSTYLSLTNRVLRRINEAELTETSFASSRGLHSVVKDSVVDAIREINQQKWECPWQAIEHTITVSVGINEYAWPQRFKSADWESFQIIKDDSLEVASTNLVQMDRDMWYRNLKLADDDAGVLGVSAPRFVFRTHGTGFGVTPSPDKPYIIKYRYYRLGDEMALFSDVCEIPQEYDNVILAGALAHVNVFKENPDGYNIYSSIFKNGISNMYNALVGSVTEMYDTRTTNTQTPIFSNTGNYKL